MNLPGFGGYGFLRLVIKGSIFEIDFDRCSTIAGDDPLRSYYDVSSDSIKSKSEDTRNRSYQIFLQRIDCVCFKELRSNSLTVDKMH
jgi:hypothetical protein